MSRLSLLILIALLAAGCGEKRHHQTEAERAKYGERVLAGRNQHRQPTMGSGPADETAMEQLTKEYIGLTRKYADDLGDAEVKKSLRNEVSQVQPWCLPCGVLLFRERAKY